MLAAMAPVKPWTGWLLVATLSGCGGCGARPPQGEAASPAPSGSEPSPGQPPAAPPPSAGPAPNVVLEGNPEETRVSLSVRNMARDPVELEGTLSLEVAVSDSWKPLETALSLRYDCDEPPPGCVTLAPGAELRPPAWRGGSGQGQCGPKPSAAPPAGRYRLVATGCRAPYRVEGRPFELP